MTRILYSLVAISSLLFLLSCDGKNNKEDPCGLVYCPNAYLGPMLPFDIQDQQTGKDWFFSDTPQYPNSALHVRRNSTDTTSLGPEVDLLNKPSCFRTFLVRTGNDTLYIQIANLAPDTLSCHVDATRISCCYFSYRITNVVFDRKLLASLLDSSVLVLKK